MLDSIKIQDAINRILVEQYPSFVVYIENMPQKFKRPSFLINYVTNNSETVSKDVLKETVYYTVTYFGPVNDHYNQDKIDLQTVLIQIMKPFRKGYIMVEDRAVKVASSSGGKDDTEIYMDIQFEYYEDRLEEHPSYPLMKDIQFKFKEGH